MSYPLKHIHPCLVPHSEYDAQKTRLSHLTRSDQSLEDGQDKSSLGHRMEGVSICWSLTLHDQIMVTIRRSFPNATIGYHASMHRATNPIHAEHIRVYITWSSLDTSECTSLDPHRTCQSVCHSVHTGHVKFYVFSRSTHDKSYRTYSQHIT